MEKFLIPILLTILLVGGIIALFIYTEKKSKNEYDERQILARGKAYKAASTTAIIYFFVCSFHSEWGFYWIKPSAQMLLGLMLTLFVFAFVAIINDAYVTIKNSGILYLVFTLLGTALYTFRGFLEIYEGEKLIENGMLTMLSIIFIYAFLFLVIAVTLIIKMIINKRAEKV